MDPLPYTIRNLATVKTLRQKMIIVLFSTIHLLPTITSPFQRLQTLTSLLPPLPRT